MKSRAATDPRRARSTPRTRSARAALAACGFAVLLGQASLAEAGGSAENAVVIIDPALPDALHLGNYYVNRRGIPARNVIYMRADNSEQYADTVRDNLPAFFGTLRARGIAERIDYVVIAPSTFRVNASGLLEDSCFPASRLGLSSVYTNAFHPELVQSKVNVVEANRFFTLAPNPPAFSSQVAWDFGNPSTDPAAHRYFVAAILGYTGPRGNTPAELTTMIDRSVAADGTHPAGTFYFMQTNDVNRSGPRHGLFPSAVATLQGLGFEAEHLSGADLPGGRQDCLGIMTGSAEPRITAANLTLLPGAFCDHLTSYGGMFDHPDQEKLSRWIAKGASGSAGSIEEPCNYAGKFPRADLHRHYAQGAPLGEAHLRSMQYLPLQQILYGDPLTRPFAHIPDVQVDGLEAGTIKGRLRLQVDASTTHPTAQITTTEMLLDGEFFANLPRGEAFSFDTNRLSEGYHEIRVLCTDDSNRRATGSWTVGVVVDNAERGGTLGVSAGTGDLTTEFVFDVTATGAGVQRVELVQNSRVVASATTLPAQLKTHGRQLGAGPARVHAEIHFEDGTVLRTAPVELEISAAEPAPEVAKPPVAYSFTRRLCPGEAGIVELPASFADALNLATFSIEKAPQHAQLRTGAVGAFRIVVPQADAAGTDELTFRVTTPSGTSEIATVQIEYDPPLVPVNDLGVLLDTGRLRDHHRAGKDSVDVGGHLVLPDGVDPTTFDPRQHAVRVEIGGQFDGIVIDVPTDDPKWKFKQRRSRYQHKARLGRKGLRHRLRIEPEAGTFSLRLRKADLPASSGDATRVEVRIGDLVGAHEASWAPDAKRPGVRTFVAN